ncbi:PucR family transcriptional regulator [Oceanobacillus timonensis]|uniref:PucR family transcriptional regulator n=1 Tax=Oceanobacillus timonensis TaxID=1926285 RepID=UPI0009B96C0F|nr:PucR family transcriptional regulator ligand-binding domain-containing protein [Oceanobacillus timonensis]
MRIADALKIGELSAGTLITGHEGLNNIINSVEVMEVPEVLDWVTPGILIMTTFYSIKDDEEKQIDIVQTLIEKGASGIVVKLGRFIHELPEKMIELADKRDFPIISIPKNISYINILMPLYEKLYEEKQLQIQTHHPFFKLEESSFTSMEQAIENIAEIVNASVYVEDLEGKLLYRSANFKTDGWRKSSALFSSPQVTSYLKMIEEWIREFNDKSFIIYKMQGYKNKMLIPLVSKNQVFGIIHVLYADEKLAEIDAVTMKKMSNKLSELFLSDQIYYQKHRLYEMELMESYLHDVKDNEDKGITIVHFQAPWITQANQPENVFVDASCLVRKELDVLLNQFECGKTFIFEKHNHFYAFHYGDKADYPMVVKAWQQLVMQYNAGNSAETIRLSISPCISDGQNFDQALHSVTKMMEIGKKVKPEENVYLHDQLGIYEILIHLTSEDVVQKYTDTVLSPLLREENDELLQTLIVYLDNNGNISKTSEKLFIHRRTLNYRINKIEEALNMDISNPEAGFILRFCLKIKELS